MPDLQRDSPWSMTRGLLLHKLPFLIMEYWVLSELSDRFELAGNTCAWYCIIVLAVWKAITLRVLC